jgi:hypothetical protein
MEQKLELKDIAGYLPYKLCCINTAYYDKADNIFEVKQVFLNKIQGSDVPILRPLSDLYRPITHNGKESVPIVELAKIMNPQIDWDYGTTYACHNFWKFTYTNYGFRLYKGKHDIDVLRQYQLFDYLHELKIDYRGLIYAGLAIDCNSLDNNPYK